MALTILTRLKRLRPKGLREGQNRFFSPRYPLPLLFFLILVFLLGGASRGDSMFLMLLRPLAIIFSFLSLRTITREHISQHQFLFLMAGAIFLLSLIHLMPLPSSIWGALPGRDIQLDVDQKVGLASVWRPLAMAPTRAWNAAFSLFVPMAVLVSAVQLRLDAHRTLLRLVILLGLLGGLLGLVQSSLGIDSVYLYPGHLPGASEGLFANRNHHALMMAILFPCLGAWAASDARTEQQAALKRNVAICLSLALVPLILVIGSRAGLLLGLAGIVAGIFLYSPPRVAAVRRKGGEPSKLKLVVPALLMASIMGAITAVLARAEALQRLIGPDQDMSRLDIWRLLPRMIWTYFPAGSGIGSVVEIYKIAEPSSLLVLNYTNHAHNDWLEVALTTGLPGILLLCLAVVGFATVAYRAFVLDRSENPNGRLARLGVIIIAMLAVASIFDYPLRTPALASLFVLATIWASLPWDRLAEREQATIKAEQK